MRRVRIDVVMLIVGLLVLILALLGRQANTPRPSFFSTYDTGVNGYRALYEVLLREHVAPQRYEQRLQFLPASTGTLFISSFEKDVLSGVSQNPLDKKDIISLKRFVNRGGRLVVADAVNGGAEDAILGIPASHTVKLITSAKPLLALPLVKGVALVKAPIRSIFPFSTPKATPLMATDKGLVAIAYPFGRGQVIALTSPEIFANVWLDKGDNARFAFNLLATHGPLLIDERVHGYAADTTMWQALPLSVRIAIGIISLTVLLWLIGSSVRFAPPYDLESPDERTSGAFLDAFSALVRRARASQLTITALCQSAHRRVTRRHAKSPQVLAILADIDRLGTLVSPTQSQVMRAAILYTQLRKELQ